MHPIFQVNFPIDQHESNTYYFDHSKKPEAKPKTNPNIIGNGNPGKIPFFSSI